MCSKSAHSVEIRESTREFSYSGPAAKVEEEKAKKEAKEEEERKKQRDAQEAKEAHGSWTRGFRNHWLPSKHGHKSIIFRHVPGSRSRLVSVIRIFKFGVICTNLKLRATSGFLFTKMISIFYVLTRPSSARSCSLSSRRRRARQSRPCFFPHRCEEVLLEDDFCS